MKLDDATTTASDSEELLFLERMADKVGVSAALRICAYWGKRTLYVPPKVASDHLLSKVIGLEAATRLVEAFPGKTMAVPACELTSLRRASRVAVLWKYGIPPSVVASVLDISPRRVNQIRKQLCLEGYDEDALLPIPYGMADSEDAGETGRSATESAQALASRTALYTQVNAGANYALMSILDVAELTGYSDRQIRRMTHSDNFPTAIQVSPGRIRWRSDEVHAWLDSRPRVKKR